MKPAWPILINASQYVHQKTKDERLDPLKLMFKSAKKVLSIPNASKLRELIDAVYMVNINSWSYKDAPGELSALLAITPTEKIYLSDGGNTPQMLVNRAAKKIQMGTRKCILIVGGEASYSVYKSKKEKEDLSWSKKEEPDYMEGKIWHGTNNFENSYKLIIPPYSYALFETAYRAAAGLSLQEHRMKMGNLFERFSEVAANNPYAWTQKSYSAEEIISPSPNNRNVCYPYTKRMCSNMFVDQSAAILITSEDIAKKLEVPKKRWVYLRGASDFQNIFAITRRPKLATSPAARIGSKVALNQAGLMLDDIDRFDIYSCFPSIVEIISDEIGIIKDDTRDLTITGGLPFFGGPWSNYSLHAIATAVNIIQKNPEITIMVIANGGYNTKQSFGIYGNLPPQKGFDENDAKELQNQILEKILPEPVEKANGVCKILGYTVIYNRDGTHKYGIALGAMENKRHTLATLNGTDEELAQLEHHEIVGRTYRVYFDERSQKNIINLTEIKN